MKLQKNRENSNSMKFSLVEFNDAFNTIRLCKHLYEVNKAIQIKCA